MRGTNVGTERKNKVYLKLNYMFEMNTVMKDLKINLKRAGLNRLNVQCHKKD